MIPNKSTFKFQELTSITGVKPYVIRFWETEFEEIAPVNSDSGQKLYDRKDVEAILRIKKLLFEDKLSVPEAKLKMKSPLEDLGAVIDDSSGPAKLKEVIHEGLELIRSIKLNRKW
jgi:DNA-binding transcriptional MerR regulator